MAFLQPIVSVGWYSDLIFWICFTTWIKNRTRIKVWERQVNGWGAVQLSAALLWSALMHRRLLLVCRKRQSVWSLTHFHSETLPTGQICQSKEQDHINIISVQSGYNFSSLPPSWDSHLGYKQTCLEHSCNGTTESSSSYSHGSGYVLSFSFCIRLVCRLLWRN